MVFGNALRQWLEERFRVEERFDPTLVTGLQPGTKADVWSAAPQPALRVNPCPEGLFPPLAGSVGPIAKRPPDFPPKQNLASVNPVNLLEIATRPAGSGIFSG
jgi:hypothetical protein